MNILFSHSYFLSLDPKQSIQSKPYPPLGTLYAAAYIREQKHNVKLFDSNFAMEANEIEPYLSDYSPEVLVIYDDGFNYLTKMCLTNMREATFEMIKLAKKRNIFVVVSSSDSTDHYGKYLENGADVILLGEGEETLKEVIETKKSKGNFSILEGIVYKDSNGIYKTPPRKVRNNLDDLPFPAWDIVQIDKYKNAWERHGYFSINIATTRGCPYKCNWCAKPIYGNRYNSHSPRYIVDLIVQMKDQFSYDHIWFCDDIFGLKPNWIQEFNTLLKEEKIHIPYKIQSRADLLLKEDNIVALKNSGCEEVWIGAESGSQKVLDAMDKGTQVEQISQATQGMKNFGIKPCFFLQFGYLGEDWSDIQLTHTMLKDLMPHDIGVSVSYPLPGTSFYETVKSELDHKQNWTDSDELLIMYKGTYQPKFYKRLHRYTHHLFRSLQAKELLQNRDLSKGLMKFAYHTIKAKIEFVIMSQEFKK